LVRQDRVFKRPDSSVDSFARAVFANHKWSGKIIDEYAHQGPEGYTITALAALNIAQKILDGNFTTGFQTPAKAYGADLVLEIEGVTRQDG